MIIILLLSIPCGYFTVFREVEARLCVSRVAQKVKVEPDWAHIYQYINSQFQPGLTEQEVMHRLNEIGPTDKTERTKLANGKIREGAILKICIHPMNNIYIATTYGTDNKLIGFHIQVSP